MSVSLDSEGLCKETVIQSISGLSQTETEGLLFSTGGIILIAMTTVQGNLCSLVTVITSHSITYNMLQYNMISANMSRRTVSSLNKSNPTNQPTACWQLTLNVWGPNYFGSTKSVSWMLMPWRRASPGHQHPWYWLCRIGRSLCYIEIGFQLPVSCWRGGMI